MAGIGSRSNRPLAYEMEMRQIDGAPHQYAVAKCGLGLPGCIKEIAVHWPRTHHPIMIAKKFTRSGWEFEAEKVGSGVCPACQKSRKAARRGDSGAKEIVVNATVVPKGAENGVVRDLTTEERFKVRSLLDLRFDDKAGAYLEGYSDQRIGSEVGVPWGAVVKLREAAYGVLKSNAELEALSAEIAKYEHRLTPMQRAADNAVVEAKKAKTIALEAERVANEAKETADGMATAIGNLKGRLDGALKRLGISQ